MWKDVYFHIVCCKRKKEVVIGYEKPQIIAQLKQKVRNELHITYHLMITKFMELYEYQRK